MAVQAEEILANSTLNQADLFKSKKEIIPYIPPLEDEYNNFQ